MTSQVPGGVSKVCMLYMYMYMYRPYLLTINNYVNCPSNFAFAHSIYLFHPPIFEKILMRIRSIQLTLLIRNSSTTCRGEDGSLSKYNYTFSHSCTLQPMRLRRSRGITE